MFLFDYKRLKTDSVVPATTPLHCRFALSGPASVFII
jgi:hypothetical protein